MKQIPISRSLLTFLDELEFTEAALQADPLAADLAPLFEEQITAWPEVFQRQRTARRAIVRADASVAVLDGSLDRLTVRFGGQALVEANQDRQSPEFRRFFPVAPSGFIRGPLRRQCERTRDVIVPEIERLPKTSPLKPFAAQLLTAARSALAALTARAKTHGEAASTATDVLEWKEGVNQLRTTSHAELVKIAAAHRLGRAWPEVFFRAAEAAGDEGDPEVPPAPADPLPAPT